MEKRMVGPIEVRVVDALERIAGELCTIRTLLNDAVAERIARPNDRSVGASMAATLLSQSIDVLALSVRTDNVLRAAGIHTIAELVKHSAGNLLRRPGVGRKLVAEVRKSLAALGLRLADERPRR